MTDRFEPSFLRLCQKQARPLLAKMEVRPGDWLVGKDGVRLAVDPADRADGEVLVPDVERLLQLLREESPVVVLDCQADGFGLTAFDAASRPLANVVSRNAPEACLRALIFIRAERMANGIPLTPVSE